MSDVIEVCEPTFRYISQNGVSIQTLSTIQARGARLHEQYPHLKKPRLAYWLEAAQVGDNYYQVGGHLNITRIK